MIPNIIHFIFGLNEDFGGRRFSFVHFLAIYTAWEINKPDILFFHYAFEPEGFWWERAKPYLTLNNIDAPEKIFGNAIEHYAHKSDVVRIEFLKKYGGIYLDMDVVCINPFQPLLENDFVMGIEPGVGLCNAVILSKPNAQFLSLWYDKYKDFCCRRWNYHSVQLPWTLAKKHPSLIHIEDQYSFFYPMYDDVVHHYLWSPSFSLWLKSKELLKGVFKKHILFSIKNRPYNTRSHVIHGKKWHYSKLCESYCVHLWASLWWELYLKSLTPEHVLNDSSNFSMLIKRIVSEEKLLTMR